MKKKQKEQVVAINDEEYFEKLYKKKDEYDAKKKERLERMMSENTF